MIEQEYQQLPKEKQKEFTIIASVTFVDGRTEIHFFKSFVDYIKFESQNLDELSSTMMVKRVDTDSDSAILWN